MNVQNTINDFKRSGTDAIGYSLKLYIEIAPKIIAYIPKDGISNSGVYYLEGDVSDYFTSGEYTYFWVNGRTICDENIFMTTFDSYDSEKDWTKIEIVYDSDYVTLAKDVGNSICAVTEISNTSTLKSINSIREEMFEENTFGNISSSEMEFSFNDENKIFLNKINRTGLFYIKDVLTEVESISNFSKENNVSGVKSTYVKFKDLGFFDGSEFKFGEVEFITGQAQGNKYLILDTNYNNFKVKGSLARNRSDVANAYTSVSKGDKVRLYRERSIYISLELWSRANIGEKFCKFFGAIDLNTLVNNDLERSLTVKAYSQVKNLYAKHMEDIEFDSGMNLYRMQEVNVLHGTSENKRFRPIIRREVENRQSSIKIQECGFDVSAGVHILDFNPSLNLFRFDFGKWFQVLDEGSFEASTNSVFIISKDNSDHSFLEYPAVLPSHSDDITDNLEIEKKWHGQWLRFSIDSVESNFIGAINAQNLNSGNSVFKKLAGLPTKPIRIFFKVEDDRSITFQTQFEYNVDSGGFKEPVVGFDLVKCEDSLDEYDITYETNFGASVESQFLDGTVPYPFQSESELNLYSFSKYNGLLFRFQNERSTEVVSNQSELGLGDLIDSFLQHTSFRFSANEDSYTKINLRYLGGYGNAAGTEKQFQLKIQSAEDLSLEELAILYGDLTGKQIMCISANNFMEIKLITDSLILVPSTMQITVEGTGFTNSVNQYDRFVVINKDVGINFVDYGDSLKAGVVADAVSIRKPFDISQEFHSWRDFTGSWYDDQNTFEPIGGGYEVWVGNRSKFEAINFSLNFQEDILEEECNDMVWGVKENKFIVEYWNGLEWVGAKKVVIVPSTIIKADQDSYQPNLDDRANMIKYHISFEAPSWNCGGFTSGVFPLSPTEIDKDQIYMVRVRLSEGINSLINNIGIANNDEINLAVTWENIQGWNKTTETTTDGKIIVDTLTADDVDLDYYGVKVSMNDANHRIRRVQPINMFEGKTGEKYFLTFDYNKIDEKYSEDVINGTKNNRLNSIPKNISYLELLKKSIGEIGYENNMDFRIQNDNFSDFSENYSSIVGADYDGIYPVDVGWDKAFVNKNIDNLISIDEQGNSFRSLSVTRFNGTYYIFGVLTDLSNVEIYSSTNMEEEFQYVGLMFNNVSTSKILEVNVIRNANESEFSIFITAVSNISTQKYSVFKLVSSDLSTPQDLYTALTTITPIVSDTTDHFGSCTTLMINDETNPKLLIGVERYGSALTGDIPSGNPTIVLWYGTVISCTQAFSFSTEGFSPCFVEGNSAISDDGWLDVDNSRYAMVFKEVSFGYLNIVRPKIGEVITSIWEDSQQIGDNLCTLSGLSCMNQGVVYHLQKDLDRCAFSLSNEDSKTLIVGLDGSGDIKALALNKSLDDFTQDEYCEDQTSIMNGEDWFISDKNEITLGQVSTEIYSKVYLGMRKPFNKILPFFKSESFDNTLQIRYYDGKEWVCIERLYQNGGLRSDSEFNPMFGFYFDSPVDWVSENFDKIDNVDYSSTPLQTNSESLYWVEIRVSPTYVGTPSKEIKVKGFRNCYTNLFAYKNLDIFVMENWKEMKKIYSIPFEINKKYKIDNLSYDSSLKLVVANIVDDNNYQYKHFESYAFDVFGTVKKSYKLWNPERFTLIKGRPDNMIRAGSNVKYTIGGTEYNQVQMGVWDDSYWETKFGATATDYPVGLQGYNISLPKPQIVRKLWFRNQDLVWENPLEVNNLWIASRNDIEHNPISSIIPSTLVKALTNSGLLWEELVNAPFAKLESGIYAFAERNYQQRYEQVQLEIDDFEDTPYTPVSPSTAIIVVSRAAIPNSWEDNINSIGYYDGTKWQFNKPKDGTLIYNKADSKIYLWVGFKWEEIINSNLWSGRTDIHGLGGNAYLDFTLDQEGVRVPYFRPYNAIPNRFNLNNVIDIMNKKIATNYRTIPISLEGTMLIFGANVEQAGSQFNAGLRATCSTLLKDASSIKDSDSEHGSNCKIMEANTPAMAFGAYWYRDYGYRNEKQDLGSLVRDDTDGVYPYGISSINLMKVGAKIKDWDKALYYDEALSTYTDITTKMNYKDLTNEYELGEATSAKKQIMVCSSSKFFEIALSHNEDDDLIEFDYLDMTGSWKPITFFEDSFIENAISDNDDWSYKTSGLSHSFDPFIKDWNKQTFQGTEGYWLRIKWNASISTTTLRWAVLSGYCLWDNMRWWNDYSIESSRLPSSPTDIQKRHFDTCIPMSIEYDIMNKKLIGCMWDYSITVNRYYPFRISFDLDKIYDGTNYSWNWDNNGEIEILDGEDMVYSYNMKSISAISNMDSKVLMVDQSDKNKSALMGNIKNIKADDKLFRFGIS